MRRLLGVLVALLGLVPATASAQNAWLSDRSRAEGPGFRLGDFELHPGLGAEVGWDSNLYYSDESRRVDTGVLRITPHLLFSTVGEERREEGEARDTEASAPPTVSFRGGISAAYYEFFADPTRRNLEVDGNLRLQVLPQRPFSFTISEDFRRSVRPFTENFSGASPARIGNQAGVDLNFQTDGGIFQVRLGYVFGLDYFEDSRFQFGNSLAHTITLQETFRFLPQTAFVHDTTIALTDYIGDIASAPVLLQDSARLRTRVGLNGAITENVSLLGMVGYAAGFFPSAAGGTYRQDYDSIVAQAEVRWQISEGTRLALGYDRDFFTSFMGNYFSRDRGYANFQTTIGGAFLLGVDTDVGYMDFGQIRGADGTTIIDDSNGERSDVRVGAGLFGEYRFTNWLAVNATARYSGAFTGYAYRVTMPMTFLDPAGYNKVEVYGGVRIFY